MSLKVYWYGIFYFISFILGYSFIYYIAKRKYFLYYEKLQNLIENHLDDLAFAIFLGVIVGGRLGYVLIYNPQYYLSNPLQIFAVWNGGMGFVGGVAGVIFSIFIIKKIFKLSLKEFLLLIDIIVSFLPFGIMIGRIGNFLNKELYGRTVGEVFPFVSGKFFQFFSDINLFYVYKNIDSNYRINSNFLESFFEGFIILCLLQIVFWRKYVRGDVKPGYISGLFLILYGIARFFMEFLRYYGGTEYIGILTKTQYIMLFFIVLGSFLVFRKNK